MLGFIGLGHFVNLRGGVWFSFFFVPGSTQSVSDWLNARRLHGPSSPGLSIGVAISVALGAC